MPRERNGRPDLRLIVGGAAQASDATVPTSVPSPSSRSGVNEPTSTVDERPSRCDPTNLHREVRIVVCGSRTWNDHVPVWTALAGWKATNPRCTFKVAHGGAQGADAYGEAAAKLLGMEVVKFPAQWDLHGRAAGFIRNKQMIEEFRPDIVLAFSEHPITKGTAHTVRLAKQAGIPVFVIGHADDGN